MSLFEINEIKCTRCNICVQECPTQVIAPSSKETLPLPVNDAESFCIDCGHCVAVCPTGAFELATNNPADCAVIQKELLPGDAALGEMLKARRSVRRFTDKPVSHEILADILDVAHYAPTGKNKQQVHWTVFEDSKDVKNLSSHVVDWIKSLAGKIPDEATAQRMARISSSWDAGRDDILRGAPHLIVVHGQADLPSIQADSIIALTYLELYAYAKGLGTCWAGYLTTATNAHEPAAAALKLPAGHKCFGAVMIGYPKYSYNLIPPRKTNEVSWR